mgnify:FL=1
MPSGTIAPPERYITADDAAALYGCVRRTIDNLARRGQLTRYRRAGDRRIYFDVQQVEALSAPRAEA